MRKIKPKPYKKRSKRPIRAWTLATRLEKRKIKDKKIKK
jgi:hypothetical protein